VKFLYQVACHGIVLSYQVFSSKRQSLRLVLEFSFSLLPEGFPHFYHLFLGLHNGHHNPKDHFEKCENKHLEGE
jgi:hypothetical protein